MANVFPKSPDWPQQAAKRRSRGTKVELAINIVIAAGTLFFGGWVFAVALLLSCIYWYFNLRTPPISKDFEAHYVQLTENALIESLVWKGEKLSQSIPWTNVKISKMRKNEDSVISIRIRDTRRGRHGFGSFLDHELVGFADMNRLAQEIEFQSSRGGLYAQRESRRDV